MNMNYHFGVHVKYLVDFFLKVFLEIKDVNYNSIQTFNETIILYPFCLFWNSGIIIQDKIVIEKLELQYKCLWLILLKMNAVKIDKQAIFPQSFGVQTAGKQLCWKMLFAVLSPLGESQNTKTKNPFWESICAFLKHSHNKFLWVEKSLLLLQELFQKLFQELLQELLLEFFRKYFRSYFTK